MLTVHHLNNSRSQRVLWLLEELEEPYALVLHQRDPRGVGPAAMKAAHGIGKAPIVEDQGVAIVESGAIAHYILDRYGRGRLEPDHGDPAWMRFLEWMNIAVSIGYTPILLKVYPQFLGMGVTPLDAAAQAEFDLVLGYIEDALGEHPWIMGTDFSAADIQLSFVPELARQSISVDAYPRIVAWMRRCHARPGFLRSIDRGGRYDLA